VGVRIAAGGARDANGSVMGLETSEGEVPDDERYDYDPYGELDRKPAVGDTTDDPDAGLSQEAQDNPFRFQGFYYDSGVKTYDMHARHYRPDTGRFLQRDQYAAAVGNQALQADTLTQNRYAFAGANPVTNVEFDGHFFSRTTFKRFLRGVSRAAQAKAPSRGRPSRREGRAYYNAATGPGGQGVRAFRESSGPTARPAPRPVVRAQSPNVGQRLLKVRSDVNSAISGYLFNPKRDGALGAGLTCGLLGKSCDKDTHDRYQDVYSRGKVYGTVLSYTGLRVLRLLQHGSRPGQRAINGGSQATKGAPRGQFSIRNWDDYPQGVPRPTGELRLRTGAEYDRARSAANQVNAQLRWTNPDAYRGKQIHEIHPVKFGGSPTDSANKIALTRQEHYRLNAFWMRHQRYAQGGP
jgi:RHS repeat-associated protein